MIFKALRSVFKFVAEAHQERAERYRDYRQESRKMDGYTDQQLIEGMDRETYVQIGDVKSMLGKIASRLEYRFSEADFEEQLGPYFSKLRYNIERTLIDCRVRVQEDLGLEARVKVGDMLDLLEEFELPEGRDEDKRASEDIYVPIEDEFPDTMLGRFQKYTARTMPLATPSVPVVKKQIETDRPLNLRRPLIEAIGFSAMVNPQNDIIADDDIPTFRSTQMQRRINGQKPGEPRYYRGTRIN